MVLEVKPREDKNRLTYSIQNLVIKSNLPIHEDLDLMLITNNLNNTQYNPDRFPGLFIRYNHPKCVVIIFRNGKLIITGLKSSNNIELVLKRLILNLDRIESMKIMQQKIVGEIVNIVVTANLFRKINLDAAAITLTNAIYEPEIFPGLVYKSLKPTRSVFLIFSTGKIVLTGIRDEDKVEPVLIHLGRLLKEEDLFKKN
jgi:transcription initiation factor TFIID TATA-box-binding protein